MFTSLCHTVDVADIAGVRLDPNDQFIRQAYNGGDTIGDPALVNADLVRAIGFRDADPTRLHGNMIASARAIDRETVRLGNGGQINALHTNAVQVDISLTAFAERYRKWCKRHGYNFRQSKAVEVHAGAQDLIAMLPRDALTKTMVRQAIDALNAVSASLERLKAEMQALAAQLPEYPVVMAMHGVGDSLGPQLMAELGDVTRFTHRNAITAFAGVDPGADQSGTHEAKSTRVSKSGPPELRRAVFLVMDCLLQTMPQDDPVYRFMDKKRAEGKPYLVYMTAGANKFLRIYYGRVKEYLASLEGN